MNSTEIIQNLKKLNDVDFKAPASTWMPSPLWRPATTSTSDLQNLNRSSAGASKYSLSVLSKLFKVFMRYRGKTGNNICPDKQTNAADGLTKNISPLLTLFGGGDIKTLSTTCNTATYQYAGQFTHSLTIWCYYWIAAVNFVAIFLWQQITHWLTELRFHIPPNTK